MMKSKRVNRLYKKFCRSDGNNYIASEYAIIKIQELISIFKVNNVLEIGLGIGSIAGIVQSVNQHIKYSGTEDNFFCLQALIKNIGTGYNRLKIFSSLEKIPKGQNYGMVIIDGKDASLAILPKIISKRGIVVIEGDRTDQQEEIETLFPLNKNLHSISLVKNAEYSPFDEYSWQVGLKIIFVNPSPKQWLWWFKEKVLTKIKYQYPGRYFGG